ncbi:hypothetical protein AJ78_08870 [Emergomyces pasteurianus Ep9510]|uniref:Uncharacterized protein n=1 Tax=Emergomyces pasteurianus Ep9510 TaxID=1447872 RepID=A0A1J9Q1Q6_9EURO|nr:hypothetical protein AJ78_08870 [Emergomyces pasteurianus Ep9510]
MNAWNNIFENNHEFPEFERKRAIHIKRDGLSVQVYAASAASITNAGPLQIYRFLPVSVVFLRRKLGQQ